MTDILYNSFMTSYPPSILIKMLMISMVVLTGIMAGILVVAIWK